MIRKKITIYQNDCCKENKTCQYKTLKTALKYERKCCFNPANRACLSCKNAILLEDRDEYDHRLSDRPKERGIRLYYCALDLGKIPILEYHCKDYVYKEIYPSTVSYRNINCIVEPHVFHNVKLLETKMDMDRVQWMKYSTDQGAVIVPLGMELYDGDEGLCYPFKDMLILTRKTKGIL